MKILAIAFLGAAACGTPDQSALRTAVDEAEYSLAQTVGLAEASVLHSTGITARLHADGTATYTVETVAETAKQQLVLDLHGQVLANRPAGAAAAGCETAISLTDALEVAANAAGGDAVAVVPDDDDPCLREIQVLVGETLWEVKVGPGGEIVENELSDEVL